MTDTDMLYMASLEKRNAELEAKVAELEGKHWNECRQIAHYDYELNEVNSYTEIIEGMATKQTISGMNKSDELRKAKELLRKAVQGFRKLGASLNDSSECDGNCLFCPVNGHGNCLKWEYEAEALALIGEDTNVTASATDINVGGKKEGEQNDTL